MQLNLFSTYQEEHTSLRAATRNFPQTSLPYELLEKTENLKHWKYYLRSKGSKWF